MSPGALPSRGLVFQLVCHFYRYWAYSSKSTVRPKRESCFQDGASSVSSFRLIDFHLHVHLHFLCCRQILFHLSHEGRSPLTTRPLRISLFFLSNKLLYFGSISSAESLVRGQFITSLSLHTSTCKLFLSLSFP